MTDNFKPFEPSPEAHLTNDLGYLQEGWAELGIDPDDFLRHAACGKFIPELVEGTEPPVGPDDLCTCPDDAEPENGEETA